MTLQKDRLEPLPIYFLNNPLEEVLSFKLLGLTICHHLSWESHISKLASKASRRLGILRRAKSFLGTPELLTMYKAFIHSLMETCSPLWGGAPTSHLAPLHAVETKAFRIIGISRDEAESLGRCVCLSVSPSLFLSLSPEAGRWSFCLLPSPLRSRPPPPRLCLRFLPAIFKQGAQGLPTTPFW